METESEPGPVSMDTGICLTFIHASRQFSVCGSCRELLHPPGHGGLEGSQVHLQQLQNCIDVLVVHLPCTSSTENSLVAVFFFQFHKSLNIKYLLSSIFCSTSSPTSSCCSGNQGRFQRDGLDCEADGEQRRDLLRREDCGGADNQRYRGGHVWHVDHEHEEGRHGK